MGTIAGLSLVVIGMVGAVVFAVSVQTLVTDGERYGNNFDVLLGNGWLPAVTDLETTLAGDADIEGLMLLGAGATRSGPTTIETVAFEELEGDLAPRLLDGALPTAADEMALGRVTATRLGLGVGDQLALEGPEEAATFRVVGIAVVPGLGINVGVGEGAVLTFGGARRVAPDVAKTVAAVVLAPDAAPDARQRLGALDGDAARAGHDARSDPQRRSCAERAARAVRAPRLVDGRPADVLAVPIGARPGP